MNTKLILWDSSLKPESNNSDIYLWNGYSEDKNVKSLLRFIDLNGKKYRQKYVSWIDSLDQSTVNKRSIANYLSIDNEISYWWLTSFVEKSPWKTPSITDAIRLIGLEDILLSANYTDFELVSSNKKLHTVISGLCQKLNISYKWNKIKNNPRSSLSIKYFFHKLPYFIQSLLTLIIHTRRNWILRKSRLINPKNKNKSILFCSQFAHLNSKASQNGNFYSHLWENLPDLINQKGFKITYIHHFLKSNEASSPLKANRLINRFNKSDNNNIHNFLFSYITIPIVFEVLKLSLFLNFKSLMLVNTKDYFELSDSNLNLWPIMKDHWYSDVCGPNSIINLFWLRLFEALFREIPRQEFGLFLHENQSWERALIYAWNRNHHGHLIAVQHSTVRFWDLRYYQNAENVLLKNKYSVPRAEKVAINGKFAKKAYLDFGNLGKNYIMSEAIRYNYLQKNIKKDAKSFIKNKNKILILGDYVPEATIRMLNLLEDISSNRHARYSYTIKPHPNFIVKSSDFPKLNLEVTMQPLVKIMNKFDVAFSGNLTSASLDAYLSGLPVIVSYDPQTLNFSPLRGEDNVFFVANATEIELALKKSLESKNFQPNIDDYFCLNEDLSNWDEIIS